MILYVIILIIAYLIGSINFSIILSKKMAGFKKKKKGNKSLLFTNTMKVGGFVLACVTYNIFSLLPLSVGGCVMAIASSIT